MTRILPFDLLLFALPILAAMLFFRLGGRLAQSSRLWKGIYPIVALALLLLAALALREALPLPLAAGLSSFTSGSTLAALVAIALLGTASKSKTSFSPQFLRLMALIALGIIVEESAAPLRWRYLATDQWANQPDANGHVRQSTPSTCAPSAAAMMLHRHGVSVSEAEAAYWCGTSYFGTDTTSTARGLNHRLPAGKKAIVIEATYEECQRRTPFLASILLPRYGHHAVLVVSADTDKVTLADPLTRKPREMGRSAFEEFRRPTIIVVEEEK